MTQLSDEQALEQWRDKQRQQAAAALQAREHRKQEETIARAAREFPKLRLVSVLDADQQELLTGAPSAAPTTPHLRAKKLLADRQRRRGNESPYLIPCPHDPHHTARKLVGGDQAWCPGCKRIISLSDSEFPPLHRSRAPLYVGAALLALFLVLVGTA